MPNRQTHQKIAGASGAGIAAYQARDQELPAMLAEVFGGYIIGRFGGRLPDIIDPPTSPNHRSIGHGVIPNAAVLGKYYEFAGMLKSEVRAWAEEAKRRAQNTEDPWERILELGLYLLLHAVAGAISGLPVGHISHLLADSMTKKSLPMVA